MRLHASCVAYSDRGVLIRGAAGSGKSALALALMALGAELVADDQTDIALSDGWPVASAPEPLRGLIEARGIGILAADARRSVRVHLVIDLDRTESERLPPDRITEVLGCDLPVLHKSDNTHFAAAILQYLKGGKALR